MERERTSLFIVSGSPLDLAAFPTPSCWRWIPILSWNCGHSPPIGGKTRWIFSGICPRLFPVLIYLPSFRPVKHVFNRTERRFSCPLKTKSIPSPSNTWRSVFRLRLRAFVPIPRPLLHSSLLPTLLISFLEMIMELSVRLTPSSSLTLLMVCMLKQKDRSETTWRWKSVQKTAWRIHLPPSLWRV